MSLTVITTTSSSTDYERKFVQKCEALWGKGFLAPNRNNGINGNLESSILANRQVLDFGCGLGGPSFQLAREAKYVLGVDVDASLLDIARRYANELGIDNIEFRSVNISDSGLPIASGAIELVYSRDAIVHVENKLKLFGEFARVLAPGGWLWPAPCSDDTGLS